MNRRLALLVLTAVTLPLIGLRSRRVEPQSEPTSAAKLAPAGDDARINAALQRAFAASSVEQAVQEIFGDAPIPLNSAIAIHTDELAEDGSVVPVEIELDAPFDLSSVEAMYFFASKNPVPLIARFQFFSGLAANKFRTRIRLAETSELIVVVVTAQGAHRQSRSIEVAVGGCSVMTA